MVTSVDAGRTTRSTRIAQWDRLFFYANVGPYQGSLGKG